MNGQRRSPGEGADRRFPKSSRLLSRGDFKLMRRAHARAETPGFRLAFRRSSASRARLGLAVGRKVGPAVVRNRIKRLVRELFRAMELPTVDVLVMAKPTARDRLGGGLPAMENELKAVLIEGAARAQERRGGGAR